MKQRLMRLDRIAGEMNAWLLVIAIGLGMLDLAVLVAKCMPAYAGTTRRHEHVGSLSPPSPLSILGADLELLMHAVVGPILMKEGCYAFDLWTPEEGLSRGYPYRRVEDAHYARKVEIKSRGRGRPGPTVACSTVDEFISAIVEREATFRALISNFDAKSVGPARPPATAPQRLDRGRPR